MFLALAFGLAPAAVLHAEADAHRPLPKVFASVLTGLKAKTRVPVLLPAELPKPFRDAKNAVADDVTPNEYAVVLYYELGIGQAGFAASFAGENHPKYSPAELPNVSRVRLARGIIGFFRPVSCGGSCAPANLWWQKGPLYQVQLDLPATLSDKAQQRIIMRLANSAIMAGPR